MIKPVEYKLGGDVFYIRRLPAFEAMGSLAELQKVIGPIVGSIGKSAKSVDLDGSDIAAAGEILGEIFLQLPAHLDREKMETLMRILLNPEYVAVKAEGAKDAVKLDERAINEIFDGRPLDLLGVMFAVFKANYMDFSRLCVLPAGVRQAFAEIGQRFRENYPQISSQ